MSVRAHELDCERSILEAAELAGWRRHGERPAQSKKGWRTPIKGEPGWPDLVLVKGRWMLAVELKRKPNAPDDDQLAWLAALGNVPGILPLLVWVPEEMDDFNTALFGRLLYPGQFDRWKVAWDALR